MKFFHTFSLIIMAFLAYVSASSHVIDVINYCGTPTSVQMPGIGVFGAGKRTINGDVRGGIAQPCSDINGVGCISVEFTLVDGVSSADVTLIHPHRFDHKASFSLNNGKTGATCDNPNCGSCNAFFKYDDYCAQRQVNGPNSSIRIQFC